jgi:hypothetical protein
MRSNERAGTPVHDGNYCGTMKRVLSRVSLIAIISVILALTLAAIIARAQSRPHGQGSENISGPLSLGYYPFSAGSVMAVSVDPANINKTLHVGTGITTWGAGDLGSQVNAAFASCKFDCTVFIVPGNYGLWVWWFGILGIVSVLSLVNPRRDFRGRAYGLATVCLLAISTAISGCGGGSGGGSRGGGIQPGNYNLVVSGTFTAGSMTLTRPVPLALVVQ